MVCNWFLSVRAEICFRLITFLSPVSAANHSLFVGFTYLENCANCETAVPEAKTFGVRGNGVRATKDARNMMMCKFMTNKHECILVGVYWKDGDIPR